MSFLQSNLASSNFITNLTGTNGIATTYDAGTSLSELYYTINSGSTWTLSQSVSSSDPGFSIALSLTGTSGSLKGIAAGFDVNSYPIIYYTTNSGQTWSSSTSGLPGLSTTVISNIYASISGLNAVIAVEIATNSVLLFYSIDGGNNWTQSTNNSAISLPNSVIKNTVICLDGSTVRYILTLINSSGGFDIYTSINGGANVSNVLTLSNFDTYATDLSISGSIALLGGYNTISNNGYLYSSIDGGLTWSISISNIKNTSFQSVSIDVSANGTFGMAAALNADNLTCYIYYTTNIITWKIKQIFVTDVSSIIQIKASGTIGFIALKISLSSTNLVYITTDNGANWKLSNNLNNTNINNISLSNNNSILGTDSGIFYYICTSTTCYSYRGQRFTEIFINYSNITRFQYNRFVPDYFRRYFPECGFKNYREALNGTLPISLCLRRQLAANPIDLYSLEELFIRIVPSINDTPEDTIFKDNIRNEFIAFALNIEKSYLYFNKGKQTCNNNFVPWEAVYNVSTINPTTFTYTYARNTPITQYDQYIIYNLSINYFDSVFSNRNTTRINYYNIIRLVLGLPIVGELTIVNFYTLIYFAFVFLSSLFTISQTLLQGKDPGIPKQFLDLFFPPERQRYYYNLYLTWIQSRNKYLGFGDRINVSNGDGTYIKVPGV
jgi:photosystem II stability/assembly factor-like uncharacterized protein